MNASVTTPGHPPRNAQTVDIIWNITRICPWDCTQCCVDAYHVQASAAGVTIKHRGLTNTIDVPRRGPVFDTAAAEMSRLGLEISLEEKLAVLRHLDGFDAHIDFSGGDPLVVTENFEVIKQAAARFGRPNVSITATGAGMGRYDPAALAPYIHVIEFTYDEVDPEPGAGRPRGYNRSNLAKARQFKRHGCASKAQTPLTFSNMRPAVLRRLYLDLHEAEIDAMLVMRTFPVGRGMRLRRDRMPSADEYRQAIAVLRDMEETYRVPRVRLQCALRHLEDRRPTANPCDAMHSSFGITNRGQLQLSAWAWDDHGEPLADWLLGDLRRYALGELLASPRAQALRARLDDNFGHCKVFAYVYGPAWTVDSLFGKTDPLYRAADTAPGAGPGRASLTPSETDATPVAA
jgi:MoaA/NifB/PqqE/SkfB family radical SAM enzyme